MACHPRLSLKQYFIDYNLSKFKNHKVVLLFCLNIKQIKATKNTFIASFKNYNFFLENRIYASIATPGLNFKTIICRRLYLSGNFLCDCSCKQLSMLPSFMFCLCLYPANVARQVQNLKFAEPNGQQMGQTTLRPSVGCSKYCPCCHLKCSALACTPA